MPVIVKQVQRPRSSSFAEIAARTHACCVTILCKSPRVAGEYRRGVAAAGGRLDRLTIDVGARRAS